MMFLWNTRDTLVEGRESSFQMFTLPKNEEEKKKYRYETIEIGSLLEYTVQK